MNNGQILFSHSELKQFKISPVFKCILIESLSTILTFVKRVPKIAKRDY